ncbi:MAG: excinuclease ABC subunit UvrA [Deltaproteobacteria bacterium]|nr:excinuclease ABC subunit UvrA [Deltaproteobacteria bacterium]
MNEILIRGAREHNLKNIDVVIPRDKLVVITGLSGSGKSSLAFDTLYAEGQRRYVESLSTYARQFLQQNKKPDVEHIDGLSPAIAIEQKTTGRNPRSTVGTLTEIYDYLRLLFARIGKPHCYQCGKTIEAQTVQQITDAILALPLGTRVQILAPVIKGKKGEFKRELDSFRKDGFVRMRLDGEIIDLTEEITLDKNKKHSLELVIDRLIVKPEIKTRLTDAIELALKRANGNAIALVQNAMDSRVRGNDGGTKGGSDEKYKYGNDEKKVNNNNQQELLFSEHFACEDCGISYPDIEPRLFSFNSPFGACPNCDGLGRALDFDLERIIPDPEKSIKQGAIAPFEASLGFGGPWFSNMFKTIATEYKQSLDTPWKKLNKRFRDVILYGSGEQEFEFKYISERHRVTAKRKFSGIIPELSRRMRETKSEEIRKRVEDFMAQKPCSLCSGMRLKPEALAITIGGASVHEVCAKSIDATRVFFAELKLTKREQTIALPILREIDSRLNFLINVGLAYLSLDRGAATLSGGEAQRIRLATQIGSALRGVIYALDEPSIGLHQRDNARLLQSLLHLRDLGNTVVVVEHDEHTIRAADYLIDMGPGAGVHGGEIVAAGRPEEICANPKSLTGAFLSGQRQIDVPQKRREGNGLSLGLRNARGNNLQGIDVEIPLGKLVCVTGVSGSGKSTLINDTLAVALMHAFGEGAGLDAAPFDKIEGQKYIDKIIDIDQSAIGRTPRSNPATYTGLFSLLRDLFANLPESRARGYGAGRYSFNVKGGRCEACEGDGVIKIEMHFLADVYVTCEHCNGRRYNRETLEIKYRGANIADILEMTVDEALDFLAAIPVIKRKLETLKDVGLGYIKLGQSATTLSGGEAQRVKLSRELSRRATGRTFYILDEPTTGLHFGDVENLLNVLNTLVDLGNTVLVIEHNLDIIKSADHIIDLGPEGGNGGGTIVATGTPEAVAKNTASYTGHYLQSLVGKVVST